MKFNHTPPYVIKASKIKLTLLLIAMLFFLGLGIVGYVSPAVRERHDTLINSELIFLILFSGGAVIYTLKLLCSNRPGLVIDEQGIRGINVGTIPWENIYGFQTVAQGSPPNYSIMVQLADPEAFLSQQELAMRELMRGNMMMFGSPALLGSEPLQCSFKELFSMLTIALDYYKKGSLTNNTAK